MENEKQKDYTIAESFTLPSGGKIYSTAINPNVELRSMTARDEMKRLAPSPTPLKVLADIIEGCLLEKPAIHVYDMCIGDYEFLLHKSRIVTYGEEYKVATVCPECDEEIETVLHLDELQVKPFDQAVFNSLKTITLPRSKHVITLKLQTPRMLDEISATAKEMKRKYRNAETDFQTMVTLNMSIEAVDGNKLNQLDLENFINNLPALDMAKLSKGISELNDYIGLDNNVTISCPKCGAQIDTTFRFSDEFFRPTNI